MNLFRNYFEELDRLGRAGIAELLAPAPRRTILNRINEMAVEPSCRGCPYLNEDAEYPGPDQPHPPRNRCPPPLVS
jgi:hypothetical protein